MGASNGLRKRAALIGDQITQPLEAVRFFKKLSEGNFGASFPFFLKRRLMQRCSLELSVCIWTQFESFWPLKLRVWMATRNQWISPKIWQIHQELSWSRYFGIVRNRSDFKELALENLHKKHPYFKMFRGLNQRVRAKSKKVNAGLSKLLTSGKWI